MMKAAICYQQSAVSKYKKEPTGHLILVRLVLATYSLQLAIRAF